MKKNILFFLLVSFLFIIPTITFAAAQGLGTASTKTIPELKQIDDAKEKVKETNGTSLETYIDGKEDAGVTRLIAASILKTLTGEVDEEGNVVSEGAIQTGGKLIGALYSYPVASSQTYMADLRHSLNIAQPAYAQGLGFASLSPILEAWKVFRNIAYLGFALIFLVIGFMIMTRQKVGQAAVTAQQALPKIIVALVAVTFSYAIAGLLIDIMYLVMQLALGLFDLNGEININVNIFGLAGELLRNTGDQLEFGKDLFEVFTTGVIGDLPDSLNWIGGLSAALIFAIAAIFAVFKLFFELLKTYVTILISIVLSPIQLMTEAIPGQSSFKQWIQGLLGNLAAFPTVLIVLILYKLLTATSSDGSGFMPPFLLSSGGTNIISSLIGFGLILGLPEAVIQVKKALKATDGGAFGAVMNAGLKQAEAGVPLTSRLGAGALGGAGGAIGGGLIRGGVGLVEAVNSGMSAGEVARYTGSVAKDGFKAGGRSGIRQGVRGAAWASRSTGMNQPDILNPITNAIDKRNLTEEEKRKEQYLQLEENKLDKFLNTRGKDKPTQ